MLGVFCNALVCLAVWLSFSARTTTDKILAIIPPITAFVAVGFEHSIANMYFIPSACGCEATRACSRWPVRPQEQFADLTWMGFFGSNLLPVTLGNLVGGGVTGRGRILVCVFAAAAGQPIRATLGGGWAPPSGRALVRGVRRHGRCKGAAPGALREVY